MTGYKQALGLIEQDEDFEEEVIAEPKDQELDSTIDALDQESQQFEEDDSAEDEYYEEEGASEEDNGAFESTEETMDDEATEEESGDEPADTGTDGEE